MPAARDGPRLISPILRHSVVRSSEREWANWDRYVPAFRVNPRKKLTEGGPANPDKSLLKSIVIGSFPWWLCMVA